MQGSQIYRASGPPLQDNVDCVEMTEFFKVKVQQPPSPTHVEVYWTFPAAPMVKTDCDGASRGNSRPFGVGESLEILREM